MRDYVVKVSTEEFEYATLLHFTSPSTLNEGTGTRNLSLFRIKSIVKKNIFGAKFFQIVERNSFRIDFYQ